MDGKEANNDQRIKRLDDLVTLLRDDETSCATYRQHAAMLLAELVEKNYEILPLVLEKIKPLIFEDAWETRVAAADAIGKIVAAAQVAIESWIRICSSQDDDNDSFLTLKQLNIPKLLNDAAPLLKSGGEEYVYSAGLTVQESKRRRKRQRRILLGRISGEQTCFWKSGEDEFASGILPKLSVQGLERVEAELGNPSEDVTTKAVIVQKTKEEVGAHSSIRTISNLNRKRRLQADQDERDKRLRRLCCGEVSQDTIASISTLTIDLFESLFDSQWIVRHGAAAALCNIFNGLNENNSSSSSALKSQDWLEECVIRCICVLGIDQYADYASDVTVAPVRQLCAKLMSILIVLLEPQRQSAALIALHQLVQSASADWNAKYGGILGIYAVAAKAGVIRVEDYSATIDIIKANLEAENDDVVGITAALLGLFVEPSTDGLSALDREVCFNKLYTAVCKEEPKQQVFEAFEKMYGTTTSTVIVHYKEELLNVLMHNASSESSVSVRRSCLNMLKSIMVTSMTDAAALKSVLEFLKRRIAEEEESDLQDILLLTWKMTLEADGTAEFAIHLLHELMRHIFIVKNNKCVSTVVIRGIGMLFSVHQSVISSVLVAECRKNLITDFGIRIRGTARLVQHILQEDYDSSKTCFLELQEDFSRLVFTGGRDDVRLYAELEDEWKLFVVKYKRLHHRFIGDNDLPKSPTLAVVKNLAEKVNGFSYLDLPPSELKVLNTDRDHCLRLEDSIRMRQTELHRKVLAASIGAYLDLVNTLPAKINPIIQGLMLSIREEKDESIQTLAASDLAKFIIKYREVRLKAVSKVVSNLCNSIARFKSDPVQSRGAKKVWTAIIISSDTSAFETFPILKSFLNFENAQIGLTALRAIVKSLCKSDLLILCDKIPKLFDLATVSELDLEIKLIVELCQACPIDALEQVYDSVFCWITRDAAHQNTTVVATKVLYRLVKKMKGTTELLAQIPSLVHLSMQCMHSSNTQIRELGAASFAYCIPLVSLSNTSTALSSSIIQQQNEKSLEFLSQLLDNSAIPSVDMTTDLPKHLTLRPYQQYGVDWLRFLQSNHLSGILADDMGLGKTLQSLCAIVLALNEKPAVSLIVCPSSLQEHWIAEIHRFFPKVLTPLLSTEYFASKQDVNVVVTSYSQVRSKASVFQKTVWHYVILDEGHVIRNPKSKTAIAVKSLKASYRLILTGTPLQNQVCDIWSLFDFMMPGYLETHKHFVELYEKPIAKLLDARASASAISAGLAATEQLHAKILPFILRRTKDTVLTDLPAKVIQDIPCQLTELQSEIYEAISQKYDDVQDKRNVFKKLLLLRKLCVHPALLLCHRSKSTSLSIDEDYSFKIPPNLRDKCHSSKLTALLEILQSCGIGSNNTIEGGASSNDNIVSSHRVLIFTQIKETIRLITEMLDTYMPRATYMRLDGSVPVSKRQSVASEFNRNLSIDCLLLTTKVGGLGLNLTGANVVIFVEHSWNPYEDLQAMDRAHRLGQRRQVQVYRLVASSTVDQTVMDCQAFKQGVASSVVGEIDPDSKVDMSQVMSLLQSSTNTTTRSITQCHKEPANKTSNNASRMIAELGDLWDEAQYDSIKLM